MIQERKSPDETPYRSEGIKTISASLFYRVIGVLRAFSDLGYKAIKRRDVQSYALFALPALTFSVAASTPTSWSAFAITLLFYVFVFPRARPKDALVISIFSSAVFATFYLIKNTDVEKLLRVSHYHVFSALPYFTLPSTLLFILDRHTATYLCIFLALSPIFIFPQFSVDYIALSVVWTLGSILSIWLLEKSRRRFSIFKIAAIYGAFGSILISLITGRFLESSIFLLSSVLSSFASVTILYFFERVFKVLTPFYLFDLQDLEHPLLVQLRKRAPGTFHHSLVVADIAYAAAKEVGANAELIRCAALYHDIGKMIRPEYFIENPGEMSPHMRINILMSSKLIVKHVEDGEKLARSYSLPKRIIDFILEHHGTTYPEYFARAAERLNIQLDSRYPGPKPQSLESVILMICDSSEAAVRSLDKPKLNKIEEVVRKIMKSKIDQGQFDEAPVTLKQLSKIQEAVVKALAEFYHVRVSYDEKDLRTYIEVKKQTEGQGENKRV